MSTCTNTSAFSYRLPRSSESPSSEVAKLHSQLPLYSPTPLLRLSPAITQTLGLKSVYVKCEISRFGLPAFKILGASYAVFRALCQELQLDHSGASIASLRDAVTKHTRGIVAKDTAGITLTAATDGNFGRAVARMSAILGVPACHIYVPQVMDRATIALIESEATALTKVIVVVVKGDYDSAVDRAHDVARSHTDLNKMIHIQDNAFGDYTMVPLWVSQGYTTLFEEVDTQLPNGESIDAVVCPVGVGSLAHAVVVHYKRPENDRKDVAIITVEPTAAPCLNASLRSGEFQTVETTDTIMAGMNCGTPSSIAWPLLKESVSVSLTVNDEQSHEAVIDLLKEGLEAGPCGSAALAGLRKLMASKEEEVLKGRKVTGLGSDSTVLLICTEGKREYQVPR